MAGIETLIISLFFLIRFILGDIPTEKDISKRQPVSPPESRGNKKGGIEHMDLRNALKTIILSAPSGEFGGFLIVDGERGFVQYTLHPNGLLLNWPTFQEGGKESLPKFIDYFKKKHYVERSILENHPIAEQIEALRRGEYAIVWNDGIYCQVGRDIEEIRLITIQLLENVFGDTDEDSFKITVEPNG